MKPRKSRAGEYTRNTKAMKRQQGGVGGEQSKVMIESAIRLAIHEANPALDLSEVTITIDLAGEGRIGVTGVDDQTLSRAYEIYHQQP